MKILILGSKGQLGCCLYDQLNNSGHQLFFSSRSNIDIGYFEITRRKIFDINPTLIINASAYTDVDKAETEERTADLINHLAVANIASICRDLNCWLIHISTDYVFDGKSEHPYCENDYLRPQCVYGESKLNGEIAIQQRSERYLIIRTAWVFSEYGNNFLKTMIRLGQERERLSIVGDQFGCPTYAQDLAIAISSIVSSLNCLQLNSGIYHFCGNKACSWFDFALAIFSEAQSKGLSIPGKVEMTTSHDYKSLVKRPKFSVLDCSKITSDFNIAPSDWLKGIKTAVSRL